MSDIRKPTAKEIFLADYIQTTFHSGPELYRLLGVPRDVEGLTIVDLAAGGSTFTADLLENGANAFAVDCIYGSNKLWRRLETTRARLLENLSLNEAQTRIAGAVTEDVINMFRSSYERQRNRYKQGWLTHLPFEDNFADFTISFNGLTHLGADPELFELATREALRITRPGAQVSIYPFAMRNTYESPFIQSHHSTKSRLEAEGYECTVKEFPDFNSFRMMIRKPD